MLLDANRWFAGGKMAKDIEVKIGDLILDAENPRIAGEEAQLDILQSIIDDQGTKLGELAADIAEFGLNPMDRLMVMKPDPKKAEYIALEGNRRAAALQILNNSDLLKDLSLPDSLRDKLVSLSDSFDPAGVEPIPAVLMPDRASSRRWIELRHTGQNQGRGIVDWNGLQTARFRGDKILDLLKFVKKEGDLDQTEQTSLDVAFPITTLERILANPVVRQKIGLQVVDGEYYITFPAKQAVKPLRRIALDLASKKIKVDAVKTKEQQITYIDGLPVSDLPGDAKLKAPVSVSSVLSSGKPPPPPLPPPPPNPLNRKTIIPAGFNLAIPNQKAAQVFLELKRLNVEKYPVAGAAALRCFVEATVAVYMTQHGMGLKKTSGKDAGKDLSLTERVSAVKTHLGSKLSAQQAKAVEITLVDKNSVVSVARLNEYIHNPAVFPARSDLIAGWSGMEAFLEGCWK